MALRLLFEILSYYFSTKQNADTIGVLFCARRV
jgi:hypothetical protein